MTILETKSYKLILPHKDNLMEDAPCKEINEYNRKHMQHATIKSSLSSLNRRKDTTIHNPTSHHTPPLRRNLSQLKRENYNSQVSSSRCALFGENRSYSFWCPIFKALGGAYFGLSFSRLNSRIISHLLIIFLKTKAPITSRLENPKVFSHISGARRLNTLRTNTSLIHDLRSTRPTLVWSSLLRARLVLIIGPTFLQIY